MRCVPVLMYHALEDEEHPAGAKDQGEQLYVLQVQQFREQMEYLHREGYSTCFFHELESMDDWPDKAIVLTFDDGHASNSILALPILQELGFKAHFFVTSGWTGTEHFMTAGQIRQMHAAGMGIGSHGVTHSFISDLDDSGIDYELGESKRALEEIIGAEVSDFSAPGGRVCLRSVGAAKRHGYRRFISSEVGFLSHGILKSAIPRCTVRAATTMAEFAAIAACDSDTVDRMARKARALEIAKKMLGNRFYEKVRSFVLRQHDWKS